MSYVILMHIARVKSCQRNRSSLRTVVRKMYIAVQVGQPPAAVTRGKFRRLHHWIGPRPTEIGKSSVQIVATLQRETTRSNLRFGDDDQSTAICGG
jgi:hypothetical protein